MKEGDTLYYFASVNESPILLVFTETELELTPHDDQTLAGFAALDWLKERYDKGQVKAETYNRIVAEFE